MRVVAAMFSFIVAAIVIFFATQIILALGLYSWAFPWDQWPQNPNPMPTENVRALMMSNLAFMSLVSLLVALAGGLIFAISCLSDNCNAFFLSARRWITFIYLVAFSSFIFFVILLEVIGYGYGYYIGYYTVASLEPNVARSMTEAQTKSVITQHVLTAFQQDRLKIVLGSVALALLFSLWICNVVAFSDWLPWCNGWVARNARRLPTHRKEFRRRF